MDLSLLIEKALETGNIWVFIVVVLGIVAQKYFATKNGEGTDKIIEQLGYIDVRLSTLENTDRLTIDRIESIESNVEKLQETVDGITDKIENYHNTSIRMKESVSD